MEISQEILNQINEDNGLKQVTIEIRNKVEIIGTLDTEIELHHVVHGENIYQFVLKVPRLRKNVYDYLTVEVPERGNNISNLHMGDKVKVQGQFRSSNIKEGVGKKGKLVLTIFAESIVPELSNYRENRIRLHGCTCKAPNFRTTPSGRDICDLILAVNRNYDKCDYIPCITWGRDAKFVKDYPIGTSFYLEGRLQSRTYKKRLDEEGNYEERTAYEVSVSSINVVPSGEVITETRIIEQ